MSLQWYSIGCYRFEKILKSRRFLILILLYIIINQQYTSAGELLFRTFVPDYNIEGRKITSFCEDYRGFLIIGTQGGLFKFDGNQYTPLPFPPSMTQFEITKIYCDAEQRWVGLSNGSILFYADDLSEPTILTTGKTAITDIEKDKNGLVWLASYGDGLFVLDNHGWQTNIAKSEGLTDNFVYTLQSDSTGWVWAGTDAGLVRCRIDNKTIEIQHFKYNNLLPDLIIHDLALDKKNCLWIGFNEAGVASYAIKDDVFKTVIGFDAIQQSEIWSLLIFENELWIGTENGKLFGYDIDSGVLNEYFGTSTNSLPTRKLNTCYSNLGGFWIGDQEKLTWTLGGEIEYFKFENQQPIGEVHAILADSKGFIWYCNETGLFRKSLNNSNMVKAELMFSTTFFKNTFFTCLYEDDNGLIWIGTFDKGVIVLNPKNKNIRVYQEQNGLANNNVLSIAGDQNFIWFSTFGGISRAYTTSGDNIEFEDYSGNSKLGNNYIFQIYIAPDHRVWFATDGSGLSYFENGKFEQLKNDHISKKAIYSVTEDKFGALWLAVADEGVFRLQGDSLRQFGLSDGLGSLSVTSVATVGNYVLVVNNHRVDLINTTNGVIVQTGENIDIHDIKAGLNAIDANQHTGNCWIGTQYGYIRFNKLDRIAQVKPILNLKSVLVNLEPVTIGQPINLEYNQNNLSFDFTGIWYPRPGDMRFKAKLEGQDVNWYTTRDHIIRYSNLAPGKYSFRLLDAGNTNSSVEDQISYNFTIKSPIWQRWWFILAAAIFVLGILRWFVHSRELKMKTEQQIRHEKLEFEYSNLRNQVNPHFLFNSFSTLIALIESDAKNAVSYVEKLSDYFRNILQFRDTELITLSEEQQLLETYIFLQKKRYANGLQLNIQIAEEFILSRIPPMTLQMLAENALKHNVASKSKPLLINISVEDDFIVVSNNLQAKNNPEVSTSLGLKNISERYRLFADKKVIVENNEVNFVVKLPLIQQINSKQIQILPL